MPPGEEPLLDALERWPALDDRRGRPARRLGLVQGARRTCSRPTGSSDDDGRRAGPRQGPRGAQGAAASRSSTQALAAVADDSGLRRDRPDRRGPSASSRRSPASAGPATRCSAYPALARRGRRRSGSGCSARPTRPRRGTGSAYAGCCCSRSRSPPTRRPGSTPPQRARPRGLAVPHGRRPARRRARRDPRRRRRRPPAGPHARGVRRAGGGRRARPSTRAPAPVAARRAAGAGRLARRPTGCSAAAPSWPRCPRLQDMREQLARLVGRGFLGEAGADRLRRFPTYLAGDPAPPRAARRPGRAATAS